VPARRYHLGNSQYIRASIYSLVVELLLARATKAKEKVLNNTNSNAVNRNFIVLFFVIAGGSCTRYKKVFL